MLCPCSLQATSVLRKTLITLPTPSLRVSGAGTLTTGAWTQAQNCSYRYVNWAHWHGLWVCACIEIGNMLCASVPGMCCCKEKVQSMQSFFIRALMMQVQVAGALFSVGDSHMTQGDGEIDGTLSPLTCLARYAFRHKLTCFLRLLFLGAGTATEASINYKVRNALWFFLLCVVCHACTLATNGVSSTSIFFMQSCAFLPPLTRHFFMAC